MAREIYVKGNHVVAKKWYAHDEFLGIYEYGYQDGSHCVREIKTNKRFNVKPKDIRNPTNEEEEEIKKLLKKRKVLLKEMKKEVTEEKNSEELEMALAALN
jgi:hypothetical protein